MRVTFPAEDGNYTGYKDDDTGDDDDNAWMASKQDQAWRN